MDPRIASVCFLFFVGEGDCGCQLSLKTDFNKPSPVFLQKNNYLTPYESGDIYTARSETILVNCGGKTKIVLENDTTIYSVAEAHCIANKTFRVDRWIGTFNQIKCKSNPEFVSRQTPQMCLNGGKMHEIGYEIKKVFYPLYEICFDENRLMTNYVKHELLPTSLYMQAGSRPHFVEGTMFNKVKMSKIYKVENQKRQLDAILGPKMSENYITKKQFLNRGHLAARADYTLRAEQRATFHYANSAPQWQRGNAGDWAALEDALRRRVKCLGRPLTVYTGTHGVLTLPDSKGVLQPIYLHTDENNNGLVPVPLYFYKLVYDPKTRNATAFVSINTSFYNSSRVTQLTFCDDLCTESEFSWLKWRPEDGTHSFCCSYEEFEVVIGRIDNFFINGSFY